MALIPSYKPLDITLIKNGKNKTFLREDLRISSSTIAKMAKNETIAMSVLLKICDHFDVPIQDVVEFVKVNEDKDEEGNEIEGG